MPADRAQTAAPETPPAPAALPADPAATVQPFHLRQPVFLGAAEQRRLRQHHDEFARSLATRLSIQLRLDITAAVAGLDTVFHPQFIERLPAPTHLALFRIEGLPGAGLLEIPNRLGIALVDRLCGGAGKPFDLPRELSEIEVAILDQATTVILKEWANIVAGIPGPRPELLGHETHPRFLPATPEDTRMIALALDLQLGESRERLHLGCPLEMIEPLLSEWVRPVTSLVTQPEPMPAQPASPGATPAPGPAPVRWNPAFESVRLPLHATWEGLEITARHLTRLQPGDVLPVHANQANQTVVSIGRVPKFHGRLGRCGNSLAVELTDRLPS
ncbi:MAG: hypothetical protein RJA22_2616 [Verrucomicrobiota bacterium]|jgi:flagellar motor switch protein FliM